MENTRLGTRHRAQRGIRRAASTISRSMLVVQIPDSATSSGRWPEADPVVPADSDGENTRTIPAVPDDKR